MVFIERQQRLRLGKLRLTLPVMRRVSKMCIRDRCGEIRAGDGKLAQRDAVAARLDLPDSVRALQMCIRDRVTSVSE